LISARALPQTPLGKLAALTNPLTGYLGGLLLRGGKKDGKRGKVKWREKGRKKREGRQEKEK